MSWRIIKFSTPGAEPSQDSGTEENALSRRVVPRVDNALPGHQCSYARRTAGRLASGAECVRG